jgi:hypothetical protein
MSIGTVTDVMLPLQLPSDSVSVVGDPFEKAEPGLDVPSSSVEQQLVQTVVDT